MYYITILVTVYTQSLHHIMEKTEKNKKKILHQNTLRIYITLYHTYWLLYCK